LTLIQQLIERLQNMAKNIHRDLHL
jgi:hypothetical protein